MCLEEWEGKTNYVWRHKQGGDFSAHETAYIVLMGDKHYGSIVENEWVDSNEDYHYYYTFYFEGGGELELERWTDSSPVVTKWGYCVFETPKF